MLSLRQRYIAAYNTAQINDDRDRDLYDGIPNCDQNYFSFLRTGPSIEACAVNDFVVGRFCPPG